MHAFGHAHLVSHPDTFVRVVLVLLLVALFAIDVGGIFLVVRRFGRLSRLAQSLAVVVAGITVLGVITVFMQELNPGYDWLGALVSSAFVVLYGVAACGILLLVDASAKRLRRPSSLSA